MPRAPERSGSACACFLHTQVALGVSKEGLISTGPRADEGRRAFVDEAFLGVDTILACRLAVPTGRNDRQMACNRAKMFHQFIISASRHVQHICGEERLEVMS